MEANVVRTEGRGIARWEGQMRLPAADQPVPQHEEWFEVNDAGAWHRLRFHGYASIYQRPGLYEHLFYQTLKCTSPRRVVGLLEEVRAEPGAPSAPLRAIDLGAGNGIVGEELRRAGAEAVVGIDIIDEARRAAERDRPGAYSRYLVADLSSPSEQVESAMRELAPNALVCVAALGFGDIPPRAYFNALSYVSVGGLLAFNIKEEFLDERYTHGFSELIRRMVREKAVRLEATRRYCHRLSAAGTPIFYTAMVATKLAEVPHSMLVDP